MIYTKDGGPHPVLVELHNVPVNKNYVPIGLVVGDIGRALLLHINNVRATDAERLSQIPSSQLNSVTTFAFVCHDYDAKKPLDTTHYIRRRDFMRLRDNKDSTPLRWRVCRGDPNTFVACLAAFEFGAEHSSVESAKMFNSHYYALIMATLGMQDLLPTKAARFGYGASLVHELVGCVDFQFAPLKFLNQGLFLWDAEALEKELGSERHRAGDHLVPNWLYRALIDANGVDSQLPSQPLNMPPICRARVNFYQGNNYKRPHTSYDPPATFCDFDFKNTPIAKRIGSRASRAAGARPPGGGDSSPRKRRGDFQSPPVAPRRHYGPRRLSLDSVPMTPVPSPNSDTETQDPKLQLPPESPLVFISASQLLHRGQSPSPSESAAAAAPDPPSLSFIDITESDNDDDSDSKESGEEKKDRPSPLPKCTCGAPDTMWLHREGCPIRNVKDKCTCTPSFLTEFKFHGPFCALKRTDMSRCEHKSCSENKQRGSHYCSDHTCGRPTCFNYCPDSQANCDECRVGCKEDEKATQLEMPQHLSDALGLDGESSGSSEGKDSEREYDPVDAWVRDDTKADSKALVPVAEDAGPEEEEVKDRRPRDAWRRYSHRRSAAEDSDLCAALEKGQVLVAVRNFFGGDEVHRVRGRPPAGEQHIEPVTFMLVDRLLTSETGPGFSGCYITEQGLIDHTLPTEPDLSRQLLLAYRPTPGETRLSLDSDEYVDVTQWLIDEYFLQVATPTQGPYKWRGNYYILGNAKYNKLKLAIGSHSAAAANKHKHKRKAGQAGVIMTAKRHRRCDA